MTWIGWVQLGLQLVTAHWILLQSLIGRRQRLRIEALERRVLELQPRSHATMTLVVDLSTVPIEPGPIVTYPQGEPS